MNPNSRANKPVIVAESNFLTARLLASTLEGAGHRVVVARNGDDVVRLLEMYSSDVLLLNMNLGRPGGIELLRSLQHKGSRVSVIAATGAGQAELKTAAAALGVHHFFDFPFDPSTLVQQVRSLVR